MLEGNDAKEMQNGHVHKVMAEVKDRQGDENKEGNKNNASRLQGTQRAPPEIFILHARTGNSKNKGTRTVVECMRTPIEAQISQAPPIHRPGLELRYASPVRMNDETGSLGTRRATKDLTCPHRFRPVFMRV